MILHIQFHDESVKRLECRRVSVYMGETVPAVFTGDAPTTTESMLYVYSVNFSAERKTFPLKDISNFWVAERMH
jgi:hypothetical protein